MLGLVEFLVVLVALFVLHEFLHILLAKLMNFPIIAFFFVAPLGFAMLSEDEGRTLRQEIILKSFPPVATVLIALLFLFFTTNFAFVLALAVALLVAGARDFDYAAKAFTSRKDLGKFFDESEKKDLQKIFQWKKKGLAKIFIVNEELWKLHLKRAEIA